MATTPAAHICCDADDTAPLRAGLADPDGKTQGLVTVEREIELAFGGFHDDGAGGKACQRHDFARGRARRGRDQSLYQHDRDEERRSAQHQ